MAHAIVPAILKWAKAINGVASPPAVWIQMHACHIFRQIKLGPRSPWVKPSVCMYSPREGPEVFYLCSHIWGQPEWERAQGISILISYWKQGQFWGPARCIRAIHCWILKTSSDEGCVTSLGSLSHCLTFSQGRCFSLVSRLNCLCFNLHLFSHSPTIPHCDKPASSWWAPCWHLWSPQSHLLSGLSKAHSCWLSAEVFHPHCPDSSVLSKLHFIQSGIFKYSLYSTLFSALGVQKTVDGV